MRDFIQHYVNQTQFDTPTTETSRRGFIKLLSSAGAGLTLGLHLPQALADAEETSGSPFEPNAFIRIGNDDSVTIIIKHLEMGQGVTTGLATIAAEELDADWSKVVTQPAPVNATEYNNLLFGTVQGTGGSTAIANSFLQLRYAGAKARLMLVNAAAKVWQVSPLTITTQNNVISHLPSQRSAIYGQMAELAALQTVPTDELVTLKDPSNFKLVGKSGTKRKDHGKSNGTATFTIDVQLEGLRTALVAHPPAFGATVTSFDASETKKSPGVIDVIQIPSGIAVVAEDFWSAKVGRDKLDIVWDRSGFTKSTNALKKEYVELANTPGASARNDGDADKILEQSSEVVEASYYFPYLAHAPMEPMNCVILADKDKAELWYGCQLQTLDQFAVADVLNVHPNKVMIHTLFAGGSFGRRANPQSDYVVEAASIAKQMRGVPIKLIWTREDDMRAGYYRPMYVHKIRASLDESGNIQAWQQRIVGQSIASGTPFEGFMIQNGVDASSVEGASTLPYHIPNFSVELHTTQLPVPVLWWRSVGHTHNAYSTETFIDELATKAGRDPVEFRQSMLEKHPRHKAVLKLAAEKANWGTPLPEGKGRGIAVHESFKSYVAEVAEVSVENGQIIVERVVCAVDCGLAINPDIIEAQMQGGIGFGLSPALLSQITLNEGGTVQSNFHDYLVLREQQMPKIEVHIVPSDVAPTGVGEPGTPPIAAAVANAVFAATGQRLYNLPLSLS